MEFKNILIGVAIIILTFLVVFAGIQTFYPRPEYQDFCGSYDRYPTPAMVDKNGSEIVCSQDVRECPNGTFVSRDPQMGCEFKACNPNFKSCWEEYEQSRVNYARNLFIITLIVSIILLGIGAAVFKLEPVGSGIMGGGLITLIYGAGYYWPQADNLFRFVIALIGLIIVIAFAYWINNRTIKKKK